MKYELQFRFMLNTDLSRIDIISILKESFTELIHEYENSFIFMGNRLELVKNEDHDATRTGNSEDGYLYFPFLLAVYPVNDDINLKNQIALSKLISNSFNKKNIESEIIADFEGIID